MNKKHYTTLEMEIINTSGMHLLAGSGGVDANNNIVIEDPQPGNGGGAAGRDFDFDFDDFKQWLLVLVFSVTSLFASAGIVVKDPADAPDDGKKHAMTLYLKSGGTVDYSDVTKIDHVTYLPGVGMKLYLVGQAESIDYLFSELTKIDYVEDANSNANWTKVGESMWTNYPEAWRLEYPQVSYSNLSPTKAEAKGKNQIIVKSCDPYGITYSLEWDNALKANRWTCYELHAGNTLSSVSRHDDFKADPDVYVSSQLSDYSGSDFSRGHLCPSADRLCSEVQNKQTFFLTNMQPQHQAHNGGLWSRLETLVRNYATDDNYSGAHCDTLYIVKAATIANVTSDALTNNSTSGVYATSEVDNYDRLLVPRYFYMALLHYNKESDSYHAIGIWTKHLFVNDSNKNLGDYAISIDKLEELTGIDFFCNLPDDVEKTVESEEPNMSFWKLTKTTP